MTIFNDSEFADSTKWVIEEVHYGWFTSRVFFSTGIENKAHLLVLPMAGADPWAAISQTISIPSNYKFRLTSSGECFLYVIDQPYTAKMIISIDDTPISTIPLNNGGFTEYDLLVDLSAYTGTHTIKFKLLYDQLHYSPDAYFEWNLNRIKEGACTTPTISFTLT